MHQEHEATNDLKHFMLLMNLLVASHYVED